MSILANWSARVNLVKWGESIAEGMNCSANMVGCRENLAIRIGLSDSSMDSEKETAVMTNLGLGV